MRSSTCGAVGIKIINLGYNITLLLSIGGMNAAKHLTRYSCYAFILILVCTNECGGEILSLLLASYGGGIFSRLCYGSFSPANIF